MFGFDSDMLFRIPALIAALTIHEYAHARAAVAMGDPTPKFLGRVTLNPIPHIDPIGLLLLFIAGFGWAKPVEVNHRNFRDGRKGMFVVSLAGAGANIALGFVAWFLLMLLGELNLIGMVWQKTLWQLYRYNLMFAVFNLIPIPPLDGSKVVSMLLPGELSWKFENFNAQYGFIILMVVVFSGVANKFLSPLSNLFVTLCYNITYILL